MSFQFKIGQCFECVAEGNNNEQVIVNSRHRLCQTHNRIRLQLQGAKPKKVARIKQTRFSETFEYCTKWGFIKEMDMYVHIWQTRSHVSWLSGAPIHSFNPKNFLHVLPKALNKYPHYRLNPNNVILGTWYEHHLVDEGTEKEIEKYKKERPNFQIEAFKQKTFNLMNAYALEGFKS